MKKVLLFLPLCLHVWRCRVKAKVPLHRPPRYKRRRITNGVRGNNRNLGSSSTSSNIFNFQRDPELDPFAGEPRNANLNFKTRGMSLPKQNGKGKGVGDESSEPVLDLAVRPSALKTKGKGNDQDAYASSSSSSSGEEPKLDLEVGEEDEGQDHVFAVFSSSGSASNIASKSSSSRSKSSYKMISKKPKSRSMMSMTMLSEHPTQAPTLMPNAPASVPGIPPTATDCTVNTAGMVGLMEGDRTLYDFFYQLQVAEGITAEEVDDNLLPEVEIAMANALIPRLFPHQCSGGRMLQDAMLVASEGRYIGLSTRPPDFVLSGCRSNVESPLCRNTPKTFPSPFFSLFDSAQSHVQESFLNLAM